MEFRRAGWGGDRLVWQRLRGFGRIVAEQYRLTPSLWLTLPSLILYAGLGVYAWRRHYMPAALPFALLCLFAGLWTLGHSFELMTTAATDATAATSSAAWLFWAQFQITWQLPAVTAIFCFVVQYAGHGRWLTRRAVIWLALPSLVFVLLLLTNDLHNLLWRLPVAPRVTDLQPGPAARLFNVFTFTFTVLNIVILARMIQRSPADRWSTALILAVFLFLRAAHLADFTGHNPFAPVSAAVLSFIPAAAVFALALFRFRILDPIRLARQAVLDQMTEGILVLDNDQRVADLNRTAMTMLAADADRDRGQPAADLLPAGVDLARLLEDGQPMDFSRGDGNAARHYTAEVTPLRDGRGRLHGRLLLLRDVTDQRRAEAQLLAQQRALATLQERERLARELHDSAGQILAYVGLQAEAIRKYVRDGNTAAADAQLAQLAAAARGAHVDVRESILSLKTATAENQPFAAVLGHYLDTYATRYNVHIDLAVADGLDDPFAPETSVQVLRVVQEALTNARKHGHAGQVYVSLGRQNGAARLVVADDGRGFNTTAVGEGHYGLAIMRERMAQVGGRLAIESRPGAGTRVVLDAPLMYKTYKTSEVF